MKIKNAAAVAVIALASLTACGEASEPAAPSEAAAPTPASSTAPAQNIQAPETNDLMAEASPEGARAFLHHVFELKSYNQRTGETEQLLATFDGAEAATEEAEEFAAMYEDGGWVLGGQPKVKQIIVTTPADEVAEEVEVDALITVNPDAYTSFDESGEVQETRPFDPAGTIYSATIVYSDGAWQATYLEETPDAEIPAE